MVSGSAELVEVVRIMSVGWQPFKQLFYVLWSNIISTFCSNTNQEHYFGVLFFTIILIGLVYQPIRKHDYMLVSNSTEDSVDRSYTSLLKSSLFMSGVSCVLSAIRHPICQQRHCPASSRAKNLFRAPLIGMKVIDIFAHCSFRQWAGQAWSICLVSAIKPMWIFSHTVGAIGPSGGNLIGT